MPAAAGGAPVALPKCQTDECARASSRAQQPPLSRPPLAREKRCASLARAWLPAPTCLTLAASQRTLARLWCLAGAELAGLSYVLLAWLPRSQARPPDRSSIPTQESLRHCYLYARAPALRTVSTSLPDRGSTPHLNAPAPRPLSVIGVRTRCRLLRTSNHTQHARSSSKRS